MKKVLLIIFITINTMLIGCYRSNEFHLQMDNDTINITTNINKSEIRNNKVIKTHIVSKTTITASNDSKKHNQDSIAE